MNQYCWKNSGCNADSEQASFMVVSLKDLHKSADMKGSVIKEECMPLWLSVSLIFYVCRTSSCIWAGKDIAYYFYIIHIYIFFAIFHSTQIVKLSNIYQSVLAVLSHLHELLRKVLSAFYSFLTWTLEVKVSLIKISAM